MALEKDIDLGYEASSKALPLLCDAPSLSEMLNNLIDNAIRYTPRGTILIACRKDGEGLRIEVRDSGKVV